jgi:hypothetical protein
MNCPECGEKLSGFKSHHNLVHLICMNKDCECYKSVQGLKKWDEVPIERLEEMLLDD